MFGRLDAPHAHELKVYTPFNQNVTLGVGSAPSTTEGHIYAFGNTAESLRKLVFGLAQISDPGDRAFDRTTGKGFVAACQGQYADALAKGHDVSLHHAESTGALGPVLMAALRILARQSRLQGALNRQKFSL